MNRLCWCKKHSLDPENATYVVNQVPCCSQACYHLALERTGQAEGEEGVIIGMNRDTGCMVRIHV